MENPGSATVTDIKPSTNKENTNTMKHHETPCDIDLPEDAGDDVLPELTNFDLNLKGDLQATEDRKTL